MSHGDLRGTAAVMARRVQLASLLLLGCVSLAVAADKAAELNDEFLEYLGTLEADDESWMDVVVESAKAQAQTPTEASKAGSDSKVVASASSSSTSSHAQTQPIPHAASMNTSAASKAGKVEE